MLLVLPGCHARSMPVVRLAGGSRGFTLVELLVVMVLLSLLTLGLGSALSTISQTQQRVDERLQWLDQQRASSAFLRAALGSVSGQRRQGGLQRQGQSPFFFDGQGDSLQWLGTMPARIGLGGRMHFRLALDEGDLVLQLAPWQGADQEPDWAQGQSQVLARGVRTLALRYQNANLGANHWQEQWGVNPPGAAVRPPELPTAVQIQVQTAQGDWPLTVVALYIPAATHPESSRASTRSG